MSQVFDPLKAKRKVNRELKNLDGGVFEKISRIDLADKIRQAQVRYLATGEREEIAVLIIRRNQKEGFPEHRWMIAGFHTEIYPGKGGSLKYDPAEKNLFLVVDIQAEETGDKKPLRQINAEGLLAGVILGVAYKVTSEGIE